MRRLSWLGGVTGLALLWSGAVSGDDATPAPEQWQQVITAQIQAFRDHDAAAALNFAGATFHQTYQDPKAFFIAIISSGYAPIMESRSQSFGPYRLVTPDQVLQEVKLTGNDQSIYEAIYQLDKEPEGWRVGGVQLVKTAGLGV